MAACLSEIMSSNSGNVESTPNVAAELCSIVRDHFAENSTVSGVAQSVVDKIIRLHRENFEQTEGAFANLVRIEIQTHKVEYGQHLKSELHT